MPRCTQRAPIPKALTQATTSFWFTTGEVAKFKKKRLKHTHKKEEAMEIAPKALNDVHRRDSADASAQTIKKEGHINEKDTLVL